MHTLLPGWQVSPRRYAFILHSSYAFILSKRIKALLICIYPLKGQAVHCRGHALLPGCGASLLGTGISKHTPNVMQHAAAARHCHIVCCAHNTMLCVPAQQDRCMLYTCAGGAAGWLNLIAQLSGNAAQTALMADLTITLVNMVAAYNGTEPPEFSKGKIRRPCPAVALHLLLLGAVIISCSLRALVLRRCNIGSIDCGRTAP